MKTNIIVVMLMVVISGCAVQREARLYPSNESAKSKGVLVGKFLASGSGHGSLEVTLPDGELLNGEFSIVRGGSIGFGNIYGSVFGVGGSATYSGNATSYVVAGSSQGVASAFGSKGTTMECEFFNDNFSGHGYGGCKSSTGELYRLQY